MIASHKLALRLFLEWMHKAHLNNRLSLQYTQNIYSQRYEMASRGGAHTDMHFTIQIDIYALALL